jgi:putative flippase GtrA
MVTTVVDLGTFSLFNYWILTRWKHVPFQFWLFDYSVVNGGLCAFFSFGLSFVMSQTFNFFIQRKATFKATNNVLYSGILYTLMILVVFTLSLVIPPLLRGPLAHLVGTSWADIIIKNVNMTVSFAIQFPMNKWVIMKGAKHGS